MKSHSIILIALAACLVSMVVLFGCEGPQGPAGQNADTTYAGTFEGFAPGIKCANCHNPDIDTTYYLWARRYQWERSKHAYGGDLERNGPDCAGCHTTEGLIERWKNHWPMVQTVGAKNNPSPPGCFACHSPHSRGNFTLRDMDAVTIKSFVSGVPDASFNYGPGNMCVRCHQTRTTSPMSPVPNPARTAPTDTISITSSRWYPHYGVQGQMLMGTGGFQFVGYTYRNSIHSTNAGIRGEGCPVCHMASQSYPPDLGTGRGGGHTMKIRYSSDETESDTLFIVTGCNQSDCHGAGGFSKTTLLAAEKPVQDSLQTLETLLIQRGWLTTSLTVNASTSRPLKIAPEAKSGALFNYFFVEHDLSRGIHNTKYAQDLLNSSLQTLRTP
jgi:hypothetical protein